MENVISIPEKSPENSSENRAEIPEVSDKPAYSHVRIPEIKLAKTRIIMAISAICGIIAGALGVFFGRADNSIPITDCKDFADVFIQRGISGITILLLEFGAGYFAFGDWLVWLVPLLVGMGNGAGIALAGDPSILPEVAGMVVAAVFGAAASSDFSVNLRKLTKGGVVFQDSNPSTAYALKFAGYLAIALAAALYEAIIVVLCNQK